MPSLEQLVERFEDKVTADEQREVELRAIRAELQALTAQMSRCADALETISSRLWRT